jgi:hypothetical protein
MSPNINSSFLKFNLSEEEHKAGAVFTMSNRAVIQNLIADAAEEKIALTFDPLNPQSFIQREAELTGQIGILKYLLSLESTLPEGNQS